ncbi:arginase family protein [Protaetiibacter sp. SSC-01]|uniref:arginase family protein n=1 Tax=Protaetiibacter sp. SSC-01 TaxID=2759943 RepID=UPI001656D83E|nr:arginase family protein [Protaetiibacter sp. SSC-01]QNO36808.1 arginase family protein [Protaetiibacter sp. SSC-01]
MALYDDPLWPRAGRWPAPTGHADVVLVGVPTWRTSITPGSAHLTPAAVREALQRYSLETDLVVADAGDLVDPDASPAQAAEAIAALDASLVIAVGGDNAATVPVALGRRADTLVTVDAHHDLRDGVSNGSPVRQLLEAGIPGERMAQLGIEPLANSDAYRVRAAEAGIAVVTRDELTRVPLADAMSRALHRVGGSRVHVDLDVDACDRSVAPACPASLPGGFSALELRHAARAAGAHPSVVSIDLTEVDASLDAPDGRTVRLVALCVLEAIRGFETR